MAATAITPANVAPDNQRGVSHQSRRPTRSQHDGGDGHSVGDLVEQKSNENEQSQPHINQKSRSDGYPIEKGVHGQSTSSRGIFIEIAPRTGRQRLQFLQPRPAAGCPPIAFERVSSLDSQRFVSPAFPLAGHFSSFGEGFFDEGISFAEHSF